jgi:hypothetical protein
VVCSLTGSPSSSPTQRPTNDPTAYVGPDTSMGSITGIAGVPHSTSSLIPTSKMTTTSPVFNVFLPQEGVSFEDTQNPTLSPSSNSPDMINEDTLDMQVEANEADQDDESASLCPDGFSGARPYNSCTEYYYCLSGKPNFPSVKCPTGTAFLEPQSFDMLVSCYASSTAECTVGPASEETSQESSNIASTNGSQNNSYIPTLDEESSYVKESQSSSNSPVESLTTPAADATVNESSSPAEDETANESTTPAANVLVNASNDTESDPDQDLHQNRSPCEACPAEYTGYHASTTDCVTYCLCNEGVLGEVLYACPSNWLFDDQQARCLPSDQVTCKYVNNSSLLGEDEEIIYIPLESDSTNTPEEETDAKEEEKEEVDTSQKHEPPSFSFDGSPFLTIELKLADNPSGIGWSGKAFC